MSRLTTAAGTVGLCAQQRNISRVGVWFEFKVDRRKAASSHSRDKMSIRKLFFISWVDWTVARLLLTLLLLHLDLIYVDFSYFCCGHPLVFFSFLMKINVRRSVLCVGISSHVRKGWTVFTFILFPWRNGAVHCKEKSIFHSSDGGGGGMYRHWPTGFGRVVSCVCVLVFIWAWV